MKTRRFGPHTIRELRNDPLNLSFNSYLFLLLALGHLVGTAGKFSARARAWEGWVQVQLVLFLLMFIPMYFANQNAAQVEILMR